MHHPLDTPWINQTHPSDWKNPTPASKYDLVVVGGGTAGLVSAVGGAGIGARVAIIERNHLGGDCLGAGCVPSKAILRSSKALLEIRHAPTLGIEVPSPKANFSQIFDRMRKLRSELSPHDSAQRLASLGIDVFFGSASFSAPRAVSVNNQATLTFKRCIVATGAKASIPEIPGLQQSNYLTNESLFRLTQLPPRLVILGGGPISCEIAQAFRQFGSDVTIITHGSRLLSSDVESASTILEAEFQKQGITILHHTEVTKVEQATSDSPFLLTLSSKQKASLAAQKLSADAFLIATGRKALTEGMNLSAAKINTQDGAIRVNANLQTSNPAVYAAGDCIGGPYLSHAADAMARICIQNAFFSFGPIGKKKFDRLRVPQTTYTSPEVASIGLLPEQAKQQNIAIDIYRQDLSRVDRTFLESAAPGFAEVYCAKGTGKILGGTIVSPHAGELMGELGLALQQNIPLGKIGSTIHCYPTEAEALKKLADQFGRTRLTPFAAKLLKTIIAWRS